MARYLIAGGGIAATRAAETIRSRRTGDAVVLVAEEQQPFYMRPLLADLVAGRIGEKEIWRNFPAAAESKGIEVLAGHAAAGINRDDGKIALDDGREIAYDLLLVATGVKPTLPGIPGVNLQGVTTFSTYAEAARLIRWAAEAQTAVVVGRGLQGVELTRALRMRGLSVTMIVPDESPWFPELFQVKGELIERALEQHGVTLIPLDQPAELVGDGQRVTGVSTRGGRELPADIVGFALDQRASIAFLVGSGIALADGVVVNERFQSTDPNVFAAGDVAQIERDGERRPIGYGWMRAVGQGEAAALSMLGESVEAGVGDESEAQALYGMSLLSRWD